MPVYNSAGTCPACGEDTVVMGDQRIVCGTGRERIARHNALRDALHDTAAAAGQKETRALLPGNNRRPADIYIPGWSRGRDAALDVCVTRRTDTGHRPPGNLATPSPKPIRTR